MSQLSKARFHQILFSTPMVQAIIEGRKTQTRRTKGLEHFNTNPSVFYSTGKRIHTLRPNKLTEVEYVINSADGFENKVKCPYGQPGDVLWCKEKWLNRYPKQDDNDSSMYGYKADLQNPHPSLKWKASIHMPKAACRLFLQLKAVRVERLQDISRVDCMSEGCPFPNIAKETDPKAFFSNLWKSINGPNSWKENPWVWVIEFERIEKPENF